MSRSCHSATFSSAGTTVDADQPGEPGQILGEHRVALVRHRRGALLPGREIFLGFAQFGALQVTDLGGEPLDRRADERQRHEELGMTVARDHLGRDRLRLEAELLRDMGLDPWIDIGEGPDGTGDRAGRDLLARGERAEPGCGQTRRNVRRASSRRSSARHGCRGCARSSACICARTRAASAPQATRRDRRAGCPPPPSAAPPSRYRAHRSRSSPDGQSAPRDRHARRGWSERRSHRDASRARSRRCVRPRMRRAPGRRAPHFGGSHRAPPARHKHTSRSRARSDTGSPAPRPWSSPDGCNARSWSSAFRRDRAGGIVAELFERSEHVRRNRGGDFERRPAWIERQCDRSGVELERFPDYCGSP